MTPEDQWRTQAETNRQGSGHSLPADLGSRLSTEEQELQQKIRSVYQSRIETGVAREQARKDLPLSTYTEAYWKIDLHNLLHFLALRMDSHVQLEIRNYATTIGEKIVAPLFPIVWSVPRLPHGVDVSDTTGPKRHSASDRKRGPLRGKLRRIPTTIFWPRRISNT